VRAFKNLQAAAHTLHSKGVVKRRYQTPIILSVIKRALAVINIYTFILAKFSKGK